jgi:short subunit dehydrogenase-like uncharacterized protein
LLAAEVSMDRWAEPLAEVEVEAHIQTPPGLPRPSDLSGGTFQSMAVAATIDDAAITDPAALVADPGAADWIRANSPIKLRPRHGSTGAVVAPMSPAAFINPAVLHRSAELLAHERKLRFKPFRYREGIVLPGKGVARPLRYGAAAALAANQGAMRGIAKAPLRFRRGLSRIQRELFPSSGFGPKANRIENWLTRLSVYARTSGGNELTVHVEADGHPAYLATARWLGEAGLLLAEPGATPERVGCLTPAAALGSSSLVRFEHAGLRFAVDVPEAHDAAVSA